MNIFIIYIYLNLFCLLDKKCPFCAELLPNPLPEKNRLLLRKIGMQNGK